MPLLTLRKKILLAALAILLAGTVCVGLWFYLDKGRSSLSSANPSEELYPVRGIDISAHNDSVDLIAARDAHNLSFVFVKATEGATFKDRNFIKNVRAANAAGLPVGAYHFFRFDKSGLMQALNFLNSVRGLNLDLPLVIDIEEWGNPHQVPIELIMSRLKDMTDYLESHGYKYIIYTNKSGHKRFFEDKMPDGTPLWICSFTDPPGPDHWLFWQHSHRGRIEGIDRHVDLNVFNGDRESWERWLDSVNTQ